MSYAERMQLERDRRARGVCIACEGEKIRWGVYDHAGDCPLRSFEVEALGGEYDDSEAS